MNTQIENPNQQISLEDYEQENPIVSEKDDCLEIYKLDSNQTLLQREGSSVKGKVIWLPEIEGLEIKEWPENKEEVANILAVALGDEDNLPWYQKLARERRSDFLRNCLRITLETSKKIIFNKTKAAYFTGVVRNKTEQQERLEEYKRKHQKHTTLYGYGNKPYER